MVVEKVTTCREPEHPHAHEKGAAREGGGPESPQQEHVVVEEEPQG